MSQRVLIAGIGNIFLQDDGFGVEVVRRLAAESLPEWVRVADFGIRGVHLAYDMLDGDYDAAILVDAAPRGEEPGTVYLIEPDIESGRYAGTCVPRCARHGPTSGPPNDQDIRRYARAIVYRRV